jgi:hypothetical protein
MRGDLTMHPDTERDVKTFMIAFREFVKKQAYMTPEEDRANWDLVDSVMLKIKDWLMDHRCKITQKGKLFITNRLKDQFDGLIRHERGKKVISYAIPFVKDGEYRLAVCECTPVHTDRGLCYICTHDDVARIFFNRNYRNRYVGGNNVIIVKDHAIRRAIERSPIKGYDAALGMILWSTFKGTLVEKGSESIVSSPDGREVRCIISNAIYTSFGKIAGTRLTAFDDSRPLGILVINTYLSEDMEP